MDLNQACYLTAAHYPNQWPADEGVEVAFVGRSNVGKSSAINAITRRRGLAKTSKTPGRTQQIVFFSVGPARRLVDLPGYGFANAPESLRAHWETFITDYLTRRRCLRALVIAMDIRRPLTERDRIMLHCCQQIALPAHILLTKSDKFKRAQAGNTLRAVEKQLADQGQVSVQLFSARTRVGVDAAQAFLVEQLG